MDDAAGASGPAQLGYGDGDEATVVGFGSEPTNKFVTTYFRRSFFVEDTSTLADLILRVLRDDGAVVYLNGTEVCRSSRPTGSISHLTRAASYASGPTVTLTAQPEAGETFVGWSGKASGTQNPLAVSMSQNKVITANFSSKPRLDIFQCAGGNNREEFQLILKGELGSAHRIDESFNLTNWTAITTLMNILGTMQFNDPSITNLSQRFFRAPRTP